MYFKGIKDFSFCSKSSVVVETVSYVYNFISKNWNVTLNYFINENDLVFNKVKEKIAAIIMENNDTISEETVVYLSETFLDKPEIVPIGQKTISFISTESIFNFENTLSIKEYINTYLLENSYMLDIESFTPYEAIIENKIDTILKTINDRL